MLPVDYSLGNINRPITIHLCHGRLVSLCIQQQTGNKLATILLPIYKQHVDGNMLPGVNAALGGVCEVLGANPPNADAPAIFLLLIRVLQCAS